MGCGVKWLTLIRWGCALFLFVFLALTLNSAIFAVWQNGAAPTQELRDAWVYPAYQRLAWSVAILGFIALVIINLRPRFPYLRHLATILLSLGVLAALLWPFAWHFLAVDACLDRGEAWDYKLEICRR